jgi:AAA domain
MSVTQDDFDDDLAPTPNGKWAPPNRRRGTLSGRQLASPGAENMAKQFGGEPEDWDENPAFGEFNDEKLTQVGFSLKIAYPYRDLTQQVLYEILRYEHGSVPGEKQFLARMRAGMTVSRRRFFNTRGIVAIPYRWPEVAAATKNSALYFFEGEKDADRAANDGLLSTTIASQIWTPTIERAYVGFDSFLIFEDNDVKGRKNALNAATRMYGRVGVVKIIRLPGLGPRGDYSDWRDAGGTLEQLKEIIEDTPSWRPDDVIIAAPHDFPEAREIPLWDFLYGKHLLRGTTSLTVAPGGTGKSSLAIVEALALAGGEPLLGAQVAMPRRVLLINLEETATR